MHLQKLYGAEVFILRNDALARCDTTKPVYKICSKPKCNLTMLRMRDDRMNGYVKIDYPSEQGTEERYGVIYNESLIINRDVVYISESYSGIYPTAFTRRKAGDTYEYGYTLIMENGHFYLNGVIPRNILRDKLMKVLTSHEYVYSKNIVENKITFTLVYQTDTKINVVATIPLFPYVKEHSSVQFMADVNIDCCEVTDDNEFEFYPITEI